MLVQAKPETLGKLMELMHGGRAPRRWWHRLPFLRPRPYTHVFIKP